MKSYTYWESKYFKPTAVMYDHNDNILQNLEYLYGRTNLSLIYFLSNFPLKIVEHRFYSANDISFLKSIEL